METRGKGCEVWQVDRVRRKEKATEEEGDTSEVSSTALGYSSSVSWGFLVNKDPILLSTRRYAHSQFSTLSPPVH